MAIISTGCHEYMCSVPTPYDITKSGDQATLMDQTVPAVYIDFYDMSSALFETKIQGPVVKDTIILESDSEIDAANRTHTNIRNQFLAVDQSTNTFLMA